MNSTPAPGAADQTTVTTRSRIATITFDQTARRNAMTLKMWSELAAICADLTAADLGADGTPESARVVILTGAGTAAFVAGADISQFTSVRPAGRGQDSYNEIVNGCYQAVATLPQPTIASIHGACVGGGVGIAVSADIRIAASDAKFGVPPARLGIGYPPDGVAALVHLIGPAWTKQLIYTADLIDAHTALRIGLVNEVVPPEDLESRVGELASTMTRRAPLSQRSAKVSVEAAFRTELLPEAQRWVTRCADSADYIEGVAAFLEKRSPNF